MPDKMELPYVRGRAWIELDREALRYNVSTLQALLPEGCVLMPAVKANAYGHGAVLISRELNRLGIHAFCVASAEEGAELRENGVSGEILILGYTHPNQLPLLNRYDLTQTVVDLPYAELLNRYGQKVRVHVAVDTGMHRLGEPWENIDNISAMFSLPNLKIEGIYTHLCAVDTQSPRDRAFTLAQGEAFYEVVSVLGQRGFGYPKTHLLSSYGLIHYPELGGDYARIGIALYGMLSARADTEHCTLSLKPVLSVKARVTTLKTLRKGEAAGYGLQFVADRDARLAVLAIGYADGVPRALSCGRGNVLLHGRRAPIAGRICMDQMLVDVTDIPDVQAGDVAVVIGQAGKEAITACELAEQTGTISNEILSRLGARLERQIL
jgi:serine/alanine racemase